MLVVVGVGGFGVFGDGVGFQLVEDQFDAGFELQVVSGHEVFGSVFDGHVGDDAVVLDFKFAGAGRR